MARTIAPGNPVAVNPVNVNIPDIDLSLFDKYGDAKIKSAMQNFNLYAKSTINTETQKLYQQYKNNPIALGNALSKLPDSLKELPESVQATMKQKLDSIAIPLVMKAQINQQNAIDAQNKALGISNVDTSKAIMSEMYQGVLQNHIAKAEDKQENYNAFFLSQMGTLDNVSNMVDSNGIPVYSENQRKSIRNIDDLEIAGFKKFFDTMLINDNDKLEKSTDYYTKYVLAPERFMAENYMNRETYDKARAYAEKELKRAGAEIQKAKFNQSVKEYMVQQSSDLPGVEKALKESGFPNEMINKLEKVNLKFNEIDPSKPVNPVAMLDMLQIVNSWENKPFANTEEEKLETLMQGTIALDTMADVLKTYGGSPKDVERARKMVVMKEQDRMYGAMLKNFGEITQFFGTSIPNMDKKLAVIRGEKPDGISLTDDEQERLGRLNDVLAKADDLSREALRRGDMDSYYTIQNQLYKDVAKIKYNKIINSTKWADWERNPETPIEIPGGRIIKIVGFTDVGDIITDE